MPSLHSLKRQVTNSYSELQYSQSDSIGLFIRTLFMWPQAFLYNGPEMKFQLQNLLHDISTTNFARIFLNFPTFCWLLFPICNFSMFSSERVTLLTKFTYFCFDDSWSPLQQDSKQPGHRHIFVHVSLRSDDLCTKKWPRYSKDVPTYQNEVCRLRLWTLKAQQKDTQTDRHTHMLTNITECITMQHSRMVKTRSAYTKAVIQWYR